MNLKNISNHINTMGAILVAVITTAGSLAIYRMGLHNGAVSAVQAFEAGAEYNLAEKTFREGKANYTRDPTLAADKFLAAYSFSRRSDSYFGDEAISYLSSLAETSPYALQKLAEAAHYWPEDIKLNQEYKTAQANIILESGKNLERGGFFQQAAGRYLQAHCIANEQYYAKGAVLLHALAIQSPEMMGFMADAVRQNPEDKELAAWYIRAYSKKAYYNAEQLAKKGSHLEAARNYVAAHQIHLAAFAVEYDSPHLDLVDWYMHAYVPGQAVDEVKLAADIQNLEVFKAWQADHTYRMSMGYDEIFEGLNKLACNDPEVADFLAEQVAANPDDKNLEWWYGCVAADAVYKYGVKLHAEGKAMPAAEKYIQALQMPHNWGNTHEGLLDLAASSPTVWAHLKKLCDKRPEVPGLEGKELENYYNSLTWYYEESAKKARHSMVTDSHAQPWMAAYAANIRRRA